MTCEFRPFFAGGAASWPRLKDDAWRYQLRLLPNLIVRPPYTSMALPYVGPYWLMRDVMTPVLRRLNTSTLGSALKRPRVSVLPKLMSTTLRSSFRVVARGSTTMSWLTCVSRTVAAVTRTVLVSGHPV